MNKSRAVSELIASGLLILFTTSLLLSQSQNPKSKSGDPSDGPRNVRSEPNQAYKRWVTEDVPYIITPEEARAYRALKTDEERENFISIFWQSRDPDPDTEENEYRDEYYERIAYANEHFGSGVAGRKTDRGRIYIRWGKPDSIESHPTGGAYDRPGNEGGGSTSTYPFETWFYRHLDNVGDGIEIEFVDRTSSGEYRIARDPNEKDAMASINGGEPDRQGDTSMNSYMRQQDSPFSRLLLIKDLDTSPQIRFSDLDKMAGNDSGVVLDKDPIDIDLRLDFFKQSDNRVITAFTVQTDNKDLKFSDIGDVRTATLNIFGRITAVSGKRSGIFEDSVTTRATSEELLDPKDHKSIYQKVIALVPGTYKVDVVVRDVSTGKAGTVRMGFVVPRYDDKKLSSSTLMLASGLRSTRDSDAGQLFVIGNTKVVPNLTGAYRQGQAVGLYMQVYNAGIDQTTLRPSVDVDYIVTRNGKEILCRREDWSGLSDAGPRLTLARLLPTTQLPAGDYEITVHINDRVGGQTIENKGKFTVYR